MRILHVTDCYLPRVGGIELHVRDLAAHQRAHTHHVDVLTMTQREHGCDESSDSRWVHRVSESDAGPSRVRAHLERALRELRPDAVHIHISVFSPFSTMAARISSQMGLPTLITVHSMWSRLGPLPLLAQTTLRLRGWPVVWSAVSGVAAEPIQRMLGEGHPVHVLPNAVEPGEWSNSTPPSLGDPPNQSAPLTVLSVMRLTRVKRTLPLASMLRQVHDATNGSDVRAVIVGDGPRRPALERYLRRHDLQEWVTITGKLDRHQIRDHIDRASIFWAPAELESFGIAPLEARTRGLPVVASSHSGVGEYITHGREGLLGDTDAQMVQHVVELLRNDALRARMTSHNVTVPPHHDWEQACRLTDELYALAGSLVGSDPLRALEALSTGQR